MPGEGYGQCGEALGMTEFLKAILAIATWIMIVGFIGLGAGVLIALTSTRWEGEEDAGRSAEDSGIHND